jgi:type II secretory pathway component PulF
MAVMIGAAEDQGRLSDTLRALSRYYTERTAHGLAIMREFFEPLMLFGVALLVGFSLLSIYAPLFDIPHHVGR